jgi:hypothetical protein
LQPTKQGALKTSSQNTNLAVDTTNEHSSAQLTSINNTSSQSINSTEASRVESADSNSSNYFAENNSSQNNNNGRKNDAANLLKVVDLLKENAAEVKNQYGLDITTDDGLGKAVMLYWKENNLDPKTLKEQLPNIKNSEFAVASTALADDNAAKATKTKGITVQR